MKRSRQKVKQLSTGKTFYIEKLRFSQETQSFIVSLDSLEGQSKTLDFGSIDRFYQEFEPLGDIHI